MSQQYPRAGANDHNLSMVSWEQLAYNKREALSASIPLEWRLIHVPSIEEYPNVVEWPRNVLSDAELLITNTPPLAILANIHASIWSSEEVVTAFCHRAAIAQQLTNCLTECLFVSAIETARGLDKSFRATGKLNGPLHGLPVSFMDRFRIAGAETACGFVAWLGQIETLDSESLLVKHMRALGLVPICKTNVPQSMLLGNTTNNIHGSTLNPYDRRLSAGGAAGGEGALLAMKGSPFGWATEIAGSARIPAAFNGLFALRASTERISAIGVASSSPNVPLCGTVIATISRDLAFLQHMSRFTFGSPAYRSDPAWIDLPWTETKFQSTLHSRPVFGIFFDDGQIRPQPPLRRALKRIQQDLERSGFEVIEWNPPSHSIAVENLFRLVGADGAQDIRSSIASSGEPPVKQLHDWYFQPSDASMSVPEYWELCKFRKAYIQQYHEYWESTCQKTESGRPVTGVIMPITAQVACYENDLDYYGYSAIVNQLDFSAVAFPAGLVDSKQDSKRPDQSMHNAKDAQTQAAYDSNTFHGIPIGLQVMCRRFEEEIALALTEIAVRVSQGSWNTHSDKR